MNARRLILSVLVAALGALGLVADTALAAKEYHPGVPPAVGSADSGPNRFNTPSGVALNDSIGLEPGAGDVYVLDRGNDRVEWFSATGAYKGQFDGSGAYEVEGKKETGPVAPTGSFAFAETTSLGNGIAVDNSGKSKLEDQSVGDVYVVDSGHKVIDEFGATGRYEAQLTGTCEKAGTCSGKEIPFSAVYGVAVDPSGNLWVAYRNAETGGSVYIAEFTDTGGFLKTFNTNESAGFYNALAVDGNDVYFGGANRAIDKFDSQTGVKLAEFDRLISQGGYGVTAFAIDPSTDELFVVAYASNYSEGDGNIEVFGPAGEPYTAPLETFPFKTPNEFNESIHSNSAPKFEFNGVAVSAAGVVYTSVRNVNDLEIFEDVSLPEMGTNIVTEAGVTLNGSFDPEGTSVTACQFEYASETAFQQALTTAVEARESAAQASKSAAEADGRAAAAKSRAEAFSSEGRKERAAEEAAEAAKEAASAEAETTKAATEEARAKEQQEGWGSAAAAGCEPSAAAITGSTGAVALHAGLTGLQARTVYHVRLTAVAAGKTRSSSDTRLFTSTRPLVEAQSSSSIGATNATLSAQIDPSGLPTRYRVEYGIADVEEFSTPEASVGTAITSVPVAVTLVNLQADTPYRFRFVATNSLGVTSGEMANFATTEAAITGAQGQSACPNETFSGFSAALPDCRAYELVSAAEDDTYVPVYDESGSIETGEITGIAGSYRAATDGSAVAYMGGPSASGVSGSGKTGNGNGNHYLAVRGAKGWQASNIEIAVNSQYNTEFDDFSADLSVETFSSNAPEVSAEPAEPEECASTRRTTLYSHTTDGQHALVTTNQGSGECFAESSGISPDGSHILLQAKGVYTPGASKGAEFGDDNLYDSVGGVLHQVNVLPDGEPEPHPDATFGRRIGEGTGNYSNAISSDGSRIFWAALEGSGEKALYVRENDIQPQSPLTGGHCTVLTDACTVQVDAVEPGAPGPGGGGQFWAANNDGSKVFFTDENRLTKNSTAAPGEPDLYRYEVNAETGAQGTLTDLTVDGHAAQHANVQGVIGVSEDGAYVYFVASGVLAGANAEGKAPVAGEPNLYISHAGATALVATLEAEDNVIHGSEGGSREVGDWQVQPGARTAEVTAGGQAVGFMSRLPLTGYDNRLVTGSAQEPSFKAQPEVFVYEAESGRIACVSCSPTGAAVLAEGYVATSGNSAFMPRWINEREGTQVYFMTSQALVSDDTNGLQDVYEWESEGSGSCRQATGCIDLLSSPEPAGNAYFLDASASGADVFITTRAQLVAGAIDETIKVYDARVDGGLRETSLACTGTGCQGVPPAPPIFATPASVTFNGVGNFSPAASPVVKPKPKKKPQRCKRGFVKKHSRCVKSRPNRAKRSSKQSSATRKGR